MSVGSPKTHLEHESHGFSGKRRQPSHGKESRGAVLAETAPFDPVLVELGRLGRRTGPQAVGTRRFGPVLPNPARHSHSRLTGCTKY